MKFEGIESDIITLCKLEKKDFAVGTASGDIYLYNGFIKSKMELSGHSDHVNQLFYDSERIQLFSSSLDKSIRIWDYESGECIRRFYHGTSVFSFCFINDSLMASVGKDCYLRFWDLSTKKLINKKLMKRRPYSCGFTKNGCLVIGNYCDNTSLYFYKIGKWMLLIQFTVLK